MKYFVSCLVSFILFFACSDKTESLLVKNYTKKDYRIPMRDGIKLYTAVYTPKDRSQQYPLLLWRTPYSVKGYGDTSYIKKTSSWDHLINEGFIFVYQDVRGKYMSEGKYVNMRPYIPDKISSKQVDESTDTFDTIEWLLQNLDGHNGKVGQWGISYPGFYAAMATIDAHPALKAVSPQAPIADWFTGDDMHHNGAFCPAITFRFFYSFGVVRQELTTEAAPRFIFPSNDDYQFFLDVGPIKNLNRQYLKEKIPFWNDFMKHGNYDQFWQARNTRPHFKNIRPAVLVVGGWYDAENCYGALQTYKSIEQKNPENNNMLVMGPWYHGGWVRSDGRQIGHIDFESNTGHYYRENIELPFFNYYLKDKGTMDLPEAHIFETGSNQWRKFASWPPENAGMESLYLHEDYHISNMPPQSKTNSYDEYISDPAKPVPFRAEINMDWPKLFLVDDQRFASRRTDVLAYQTIDLQEELTIAGPVMADLYVSTSGTDSDWIVKLIDVFPDTISDPERIHLAGYQMLVRGEIMRGKFRNSFEFPEAMKPGKITNIKINLNDICHTFKKGHKLMIQIQSSWFPLFDRNPQKFTDIYNADESEFKQAIQRIYFSKKYPTHIKFVRLK